MFLSGKDIFHMDNDKDWYVYFDNEEMDNMINMNYDVVGVDLNLILHLQ